MRHLAQSPHQKKNKKKSGRIRGGRFHSGHGATLHFGTLRVYDLNREHFFQYTGFALGPVSYLLPLFGDQPVSHS